VSSQCDPTVGGRDCWDISADVPWSISATRYISSPTSIRYVNEGAGPVRLLCAYPPAAHLAAGRLSTWLWGEHRLNRPYFHFLVQTEPGSPASADYYRIQANQFMSPSVILAEIIGNTVTRTWQKDYDQHRPAQTWHRWRASWYYEFGNLIVHFDEWTGNAWAALVEPFTVNDPVPVPALYARCGISLHAISDTVLYLDDTEIMSLD